MIELGYNVDALRSQFGNIASDALPQLFPQPEWDGTAGSGFSVEPSDPTRTTAKPSAHFLVPPDQTFTDELLVIVQAWALDGDTLIGGIDSVRFTFEGRSTRVVDPGFHSLTDANGKNGSYFGHAVKLRKPGGVEGAARLTAEIIPADAQMQARVITMLVYPKDTLYDGELELAPSQSEITGSRYKSFKNAFSYIHSQQWANSRIIVTETADLEIERPTGKSYTPKSYIRIETADDVTVTIKKPAANLNDRFMRSRFNKLWFHGERVVFDFSTWSEFYVETGSFHVFDGATLTNSNGRDSLFFGGVYLGSWRFRGGNYFLECTASELQDTFRNARLVRGCDGFNLTGDVVSAAKCVTGSTFSAFSAAFFRTPEPAFTVQYSGSASTATIALSGNSDSNDRTITLKQDGTVLDQFTVGWFGSDISNNTFSIQNVVDWINSHSGWLATPAVPASQRRATTLSLAGINAFGGFGDTDAKSAALQFIAATDLHEDWYASGGGNQENIIVSNCLAYDHEGAQMIHLKDASSLTDSAFVNNALHPSGPVLDFTNIATDCSHVVFAHLSLARQTMRLRTESGAKFDARCAILGSAIANISWGGSVDPDLTIDANHTIGAAPSGATNHSEGGTTASQYIDVEQGDFTPAGELLVNLKPAKVSRNRNGSLRADSGPAGAL